MRAPVDCSLLPVTFGLHGLTIAPGLPHRDGYSQTSMLDQERTWYVKLLNSLCKLVSKTQNSKRNTPACQRQASRTCADSNSDPFRPIVTPTVIVLEHAVCPFSVCICVRRGYRTHRLLFILPFTPLFAIPADAAATYSYVIFPLMSIQHFMTMSTVQWNYHSLQIASPPCNSQALACTCPEPRIAVSLPFNTIEYDKLVELAPPGWSASRFSLCANRCAGECLCLCTWPR